MELKLIYYDTIYNVNIRINHTNVELKLQRTILYLYYALGINHTNVELKLNLFKSEHKNNPRINHTNVELKLP